MGKVWNKISCHKLSFLSGLRKKMNCMSTTRLMLINVENKDWSGIVLNFIVIISLRRDFCSSPVQKSRSDMHHVSEDFTHFMYVFAKTKGNRFSHLCVGSGYIALVIQHFHGNSEGIHYLYFDYIIKGGL